LHYGLKEVEIFAMNDRYTLAVSTDRCNTFIKLFCRRVKT